MKRNRTKSLVVLIFLTFALLLPLSARADQDVANQVQLVKSALNYDRLSKTSYLTVSVTNTGKQLLLTPITVVVTSVSPSSVAVSNADGATSDGNPYFLYSTPTGVLAPGQSIAAKTWRFSNPSDLRFTYATDATAPLLMLDAPTLFSSTSGEGGLRLGWNSVPGASSYQLFWGFNSSVGPTNYSGTVDTTCNTFDHISGLINDQTYYYRVQACVGATCTALSNLVSANYDLPSNNSGSLLASYLTAPLQGIIIPIANGFEISWTPVWDGATSYKIYWGNSAVSLQNYSGSAVTTCPEFDHTPVAPDTYYYKVQTCNASLCSPLSQWTVSNYILPPQLATPTTITNGFEISWPLVSCATSYKLFWGDASVSDQHYAGMATTSNTYYDQTAVPAGSYCYRAKACNGSTCSGLSNVVSNLLNAPVLSAPQLIDNGLQLSWTSVPGATSYSVYWADYRSVSDVNYTGSVQTNQLSYSQTGLSAGTSHYFVVKGCNGSVCGPLSDIATDSGFCPSNPSPASNGSVALATPVLANPTLITNGLQFTWSSVPGAASYTLYWGDNSVTTANLYYNQTGVATDTYYYVVKACNGSECTGLSNMVNNYLSAPTLAINRSTNGFQLTWSSVPVAASYTLYWDNNYVGSTNYTGSVTTANLYYNQTGVAADTYYYRVKACNGSECTDLSNTVSNYLLTPPLMIEQITNGIELYWGSQPLATSYKVYWGNSSVSDVNYVGAASTTNTNYTQTGVTEGTYYYRVKACDGSACGALSNIVPVPSNPPPASGGH